MEWPLFGELVTRPGAQGRAFLRPGNHRRRLPPPGVVPGAVIAAILDREFHSIVVSRRYQSEVVRETPAIFGNAPPARCPRQAASSSWSMNVRFRRDHAPGGREQSSMAGRQQKSARPWRSGRVAYEPDYHALATDSTIVLPWDREVLFQGELVPNPLYRETLDRQ